MMPPLEVELAVVQSAAGAAGATPRHRLRRLAVGSDPIRVLTADAPASVAPALYVCDNPALLRDLLDESPSPTPPPVLEIQRVRALCALWGVAWAPPADDGIEALAASIAESLDRLRAVPVALRLAAAACLERIPDGPATAALITAMTPSDPDRVPSVLDGFALHPNRPGKRELPPPESYRPIDAQSLSAALDCEGALSRILTGYEPREGQLRMLEAVAEALNVGRHLMVEAGTGVGKSMAYLLPVIRWAEQNRTPVVVSTYTRNLQTQLAEKDIPLLAGVLGHEPRVALIKGRGNYLCLRRLLFLMEHVESELDPEEVDAVIAALVWAGASADGDLDDLLGRQPQTAPLLGRLTSCADECPGTACRAYRRCFVQRARTRALGADLVIANHALVFAELDLDQVALPPYQHIVFDEAHNLEDAATRHFTVEVTAQRLSVWLRRLWRGSRRRPRGALATLMRQAQTGLLAGGGADALRALVREARHCLERARDDGTVLFGTLRHLPGLRGTDARRYRAGDPAGADWRAVREAMARLTDTLGDLVQALDAICTQLDALAADELPLWRDLAQDPRAALGGLQGLIDDCAFVMRADSAAHVYWVQPEAADGDRAALFAAPLEVSEMLARTLYAERASVILCSATLSVNGNFAFVAERLGLDRIEPERLTTCKVTSPFDYRHQARVLTPMFLPDPGETGAYEEAFCALLLEVVRSVGGRTLVLFTSYAMLKTCASTLARPLHVAGIRLLAQGQGVSRNAITRAFRDGGRSVLFGTHAFWEGVDIMGEALSCVVLARLPFPAVGDPLVEARCEHLAQVRERDAFRGYMLPLAVLRFRQGFGRLIRHRNDRGIVIVADGRILRKTYGIWFRRDLPCPIARYEQAQPLMSELNAFLAPRSAE